MHEVKIRIECIDHAVLGRTGYAAPIVREVCYLQLRMLCELIALSCLVAHGDITFLQPHKLGKASSPEVIIDRLTKLRPHFYPISVSQQVNQLSDRRHFNLTPVNPSPLSKEHLLSLYGKCHRHLHRGSLKKLLTMDVREPLDTRIDAPEIIKWAQRLNDLLSCHAIAVDEKTLILCILRNVDDENKVQVVTALANEIQKS
ncbi:MAG: hypothetical protein ACLQF1_15050 [Methyloceanibacter sp.]